MRKVQDWKTGTSFQGAIYKHEEEYIVRFKNLDGKLLPGSDYFTNDLQDAMDTCDYQINWSKHLGLCCVPRRTRLY